MALLKIGSFGKDVRSIQEMLNQLVGARPRLHVDGVFGPKTRDRVVQFQTDSRLSRDGTVGPLTGKALVTAVLASMFKVR
jgi:peptidoglycan hydrolase-like protein with peptidoglycan-binding domain